MISRDFYLNKLISRMHNGMVKIVTGIRRCGKSYLLFSIFRNYLTEQGIDEDHIITVELDRISFEKQRDRYELCRYVKSKITDEKQYYVLIDEIQMCDGFEPVLNEFLHIKNADVYVTGSNSHLLSKDVITEFRGRGDEVHLNPLSFREFYGTRTDFDEAWEEYCTFGGMPLVLSKKDEEEKMGYLKDLFSETYIKDIKERNGIKNDEILGELLNVISSSIGSLTNVQKLTDTFRTVGNVSVSPNTVKDYLEYLEDAYVIRKSLRYDIKGKKYINTPSKYYFTDLGLRNARLNFRQSEYTHIMENIIYNELCIRGFSVDVGVVEVNERKENGTYVRKQLECDFVINKGNQRYYIQSAYALYDDEKERQEKRSLLKIDDSFRKIIIVRHGSKRTVDDNGIVTIPLKEFLLGDPKTIFS
jgi:uncharacterized protein